MFFCLMKENEVMRMGSRMLTRVSVFLFLFFCVGLCLAQESFPQNYFMFPFNPGKTNFLSGNMGELRTNHFHGGIDVKTASQVGLPILAAADGYVSKVKVSSYSYGNVVFITHPNGFVTVYAHLDKFNKEIAAYVRQKQYEKETFEIELTPASGVLVIKKGEQVGLSGNTGSSAGPHLHFEIRDKNDKLFNPLMFGFPEIKDDMTPAFEKLVLRTFEPNARVNHEFGRFEFTPVKHGKNFQIPGKISAKGSVGIEIKANDKMNFTHNSYGVSCIEVKVDGKETFYHNLKTLPFEDHKYINAHIDYENFIKKGKRYERCYVSDGNKLSTYKKSTGNGKLAITDTLPHNVEINIYDAYNNTSTLSFVVQATALNSVPAAAVARTNISSEVSTQLFENILMIKDSHEGGSAMKLFSNKKIYTYAPDYVKNGQAVYLYDMRKGMPDSIEIAGKMKRLDYAGSIPSGRDASFKTERTTINFSKDCLFDTLYLQLKDGLTPDKHEVWQVNDMSIPFFKPPLISFVPLVPVAGKLHTLVYNVSRWPQFEGGRWEGESISFTPKNLGKYSLGSDTVKPVIKFINKVGNSVRFNIFDRNSGVGTFKARLNGKWLLMNYDHKRKLIWSEAPNSEEKIKGEFVLEVTDNSGNTNTFRKTFL